MLDLRAWITEGSRYFRDHVYLIIGNFGAELALAFLIAWFANKLLTWRGKGKGNLTANSLWYQAFREDKPDGATPWAHVELTDGSAFWGYVRGNSAEAGSVDDREITLDGLALKYRPAPAAGSMQPASVKTIGDRWECVIIRSSEIRFIKVQYIDDISAVKVWSDRRTRAMIQDGLATPTTKSTEVVPAP